MLPKARISKVKPIERIDLINSPIYYRDKCYDRAILRDVYYNNEYNIKSEDVIGKVVFDIGAHIGSFTRLALKLGAKLVIAAEAYYENYEYLVKNTSLFKNYCIPMNVAILGNTTKKFIKFKKSNDVFNTGGGSVNFDHDVVGDDIPIVCFDDLFSIYGRCDLLKLDCEGSEFDIIYNSNNIKQVKKIVGEYHEMKINDIDDLLNYLRNIGFEANRLNRKRSLGHFIAIKK